MFEEHALVYQTEVQKAALTAVPTEVTVHPGTQSTQPAGKVRLSPDLSSGTPWLELCVFSIHLKLQPMYIPVSSTLFC